MPISKESLEAYSQGQITRRDIEARVGEPVSFGQLLMQLHEHNLPLPRFPADRQSLGVQLIKRLAERAARVG
jgi:hypothetical protein